MYCVPRKIFVEYLLKDKQKLNCITIRQEQVNYANSNESILKGVIASDQTFPIFLKSFLRHTGFNVKIKSS